MADITALGAYEEQDFFNEVLLSLTEPKRAFNRYVKGKESDYAKNRVRSQLLGATKIMVADSLLEHAVLASMSPPSVLMDMFYVAKPPFENLWIEWNEKKRTQLLVDAYARLGITASQGKEADKVGYHIEHNLFPDEPTPCYMQYASAGGKLFVEVAGIYMQQDNKLDQEWAQRNSANHIDTVSKEEFAKQQMAMAQAFLGESYIEYWLGKTASDAGRWQGKNRRAVSEFSSHLGMGIHECAGMITDQPLIETTKAWLGHLKLHGGDMRFLIAVFALMNYPHIVVERELAKGVDRVLYGRRVPRNEVRVLEIDLPKPRGVKRYERMFKGGGGPKRQHVRRGHWRLYHHKDGRVTERWIAEQVVGNAALGVIEHEYKLMTKGVK